MKQPTVLKSVAGRAAAKEKAKQLLDAASYAESRTLNGGSKAAAKLVTQANIQLKKAGVIKGKVSL